MSPNLFYSNSFAFFADFSTEQCNEISVILNSGDVLSAEVPQYLDGFARKIANSGKVDNFRAQNPNNAFDWLKINLPGIYQEIVDFLEKHGHRCVMEVRGIMRLRYE